VLQQCSRLLLVLLLLLLLANAMPSHQVLLVSLQQQQLLQGPCLLGVVAVSGLGQEQQQQWRLLQLSLLAAAG
jgi:hypothetical protein